MANAPTSAEQLDLAYHFYTFILTSFIDYLTAHLPETTVEQMLRNVAGKVGAKIHKLVPEGIDAPEDVMRYVLATGGRTMDGNDVVACPQAAHITATAKTAGGDIERVVANGCRMCRHLVAGAVREAGADVSCSQTIACGATSCNFEVTDGG